MLSDVKNKILNSEDYDFYKSNYEKLLEENERLKEEIKNLKDEKENFIKNILANQIELKNYLNNIQEDNVQNTDKILSEQAKESIFLNKLSEAAQTIISTQNINLSYLEEFKEEQSIKEDKHITHIREVKYNLSHQNKYFDELSKENDRIIDALLSNQEHLSRDMKRNYDLLTSVEELGLRVEKSSAYTNIKLDSKFDDNTRLMNKYSDKLCESISKSNKD